MAEAVERIKVMIPIGFPNVEQLVVGTKLKPDKVRTLINQMYVSRLRLIGIKKKEMGYRAKRSYKEGFVSLNAIHLKSLLGFRYKLYIDFLCQKGLVTRRKSFSSEATYRPGEMSMQFMFRPDSIHSTNSLRHFRKEYITDKTTIKAINRELGKRQLTNPKSKRVIVPEVFHLALIDMEQMIKFDSSAAEEWANQYLATNPPIDNILDKLSGDLELIDSVNDGQYSLKIDCFGERIHTPIKRISKRMRPFMFFEGYQNHDLVSIDICNSQLYFANLLFNRLIVDSIIPEFSIITHFTSKYRNTLDVQRFIELTTKGEIYSAWQRMRNLETRDQAKEELFKIIFSRRYSKFPGKKDFKKLYPNVWKCFDFIKSLTDKQLKFIPETYVNKKGQYSEDLFYKNLSCSLQRLESRIFIKIICKALSNEGVRPFLTIHDSVFVLSKDQNITEEIIKEGFIKLGLCPPKLKIESNKIKNLH